MPVLQHQHTTRSQLGVFCSLWGDTLPLRGALRKGIGPPKLKRTNPPEEARPFLLGILDIPHPSGAVNPIPWGKPPYRGKFLDRSVSSDAVAYPSKQAKKTTARNLAGCR